MNIESGFLIVKTFRKLYRDHIERFGLPTDVYALPSIGKSPESYRIQYRGLDRDALDPYEESEILAEIRMAELKKDGRCEDGFLFDVKDVQDVLGFLDDSQEFEVVWTRTIQSKSIPPNGYYSIGYEPSFFDGDHFSASCDCMLFPRWHGTDKEGALFLDHFRKLNKHGMFSSREEAYCFLNYYLSFDWTESGEYEIAEVYVQLETGMN